MSKSKIKRIDKESPDLLRENVKRLKELFPGIVSEGKVDFSRLREIIGDEVDDRPEKYSFTWAGKRDAIRMLQAPSRATLVPTPEESVNFDQTSNIFIEGENLEVLKLLYKSYAGRVKMIYIDPPYNTGQDFIYPDNFADPLDTYLKLTGQKDSEGNLLTSNPETSGRFHSAWLSMMYPRLFVARQLLREDGVIFISIDDNEVNNLRLLMNEIFGEENFIATICWQKKQSPQRDATYFSDMHDYILVYARKTRSNKVEDSGWKSNLFPRGSEQEARYKNPDNDPRGDWASVDCTINKTADERPNLYYPIKNPITGKEVLPSKQRTWAFEKAKMLELVADNRLWWGEDGSNFPRLKCFLTEVQKGVVPSTLWLRTEFGDNQEAAREIKTLFSETYGVFDTPKPTRLIRGMLTLTTSADAGEPEIIMDFFAGSATTAHAVLAANHEDEANFRFITIQFPEPTGRKEFTTIADIGKERVRRVIKKLKKEKQPKLNFKSAPADLGFKVFKLVESNFKPWKGVEKRNGKDYSETMEMFTDPLAKGWEPINVIYEVALKEGYSLNIRIDEVKGIKGNRVYQVTDSEKGQSFMICLDNDLKQASVKVLNLKKDDLFICRDAALTDELAANLALQCKLKTI